MRAYGAIEPRSVPVSEFRIVRAGGGNCQLWTVNCQLLTED